MTQQFSPDGTPWFQENPFQWSDELVAKLTNWVGPGVVYDIETLVNCFTINAESIDRDDNFTWEISFRRNDIVSLLQWFAMLEANQTTMIGYNNLNFDYPIIHMIKQYGTAITVDHIYAKSQQIITSGDRFGHQIWQSDRFAPQIDLYKIHHFDNVAKSQSLKGLEFNMRSFSVQDMPVAHGTPITSEEIDQYLIPYNRHDVRETKRFALISAEAINFRRELSNMLEGDVLNFNETKVGKQLLIQRLGDDLCFTRDPNTRRKEPNQTFRSTIALKDVIFPYVSFQEPEFNRVLNWMKAQTLTPADLDIDDDNAAPARVSTKGVFKGVHATINGFEFHFGTGGIHGSVANQKFEADDDWGIDDIDVKALYPTIAIVNRLAPAHLGEPFVVEYAKLPQERAKHAKGTTGNGLFKLGGNGAYGDSNSPFSPLYDPQFTMTITINGQLMLCMLAERLMKIPTFQMIQINTDGMTYRIHKTMRPVAEAIRAEWERFTMLELEWATYKRMWIRDVNNYVGESPNGKLKLKGEYWFPNGSDYEGGWTEAISKAGPSAWHKDLGAQIVQRAAVMAMVHGVNPLHFMHGWRDPFDYMLRAKATSGAQLYIGDRPVQKTTRYYITHEGGPLRKISPATGTPGQFKRGTKVSEFEYNRLMKEIGPDVWDARIHTKNKSKYDERETSLQSGWLVSKCNIASDFSFDKINLGWYLEQTRKLIIG